MPWSGGSTCGAKSAASRPRVRRRPRLRSLIRRPWKRVWRKSTPCSRAVPSGRRGSKFLDLAALHDWCKHAHAAQDRVPRALAQAILKRMDASEMSPPQRQFVVTGPIGALQQELLRHVAEAADLGRALQRLERYEQTRLNVDARLLAEECRFLALSPSEEYRQLGLAIERHYRNANLRMAVSGELLNRLIPSRGPEYAAVNDTVLGLPVHGQSTTQTQVRVKLLPSPNRLLLSLEVAGRVSSLTSATSGPATFINDSDSMYAAHKPMEVDLAGNPPGRDASRSLQRDEAAERDD